MAKYKYKRVDTSTIKGIKLSEKLQSIGWNIISFGFFTIDFEKKIIKDKNNE